MAASTQNMAAVLRRARTNSQLVLATTAGSPSVMGRIQYSPQCNSSVVWGDQLKLEQIAPSPTILKRLEGSNATRMLAQLEGRVR